MNNTIFKLSFYYMKQVRLPHYVLNFAYGYNLKHPLKCSIIGLGRR